MKQLCSLLGFFPNAQCITVKGGGLWPTCASRFDWHGGVSQYPLRRASRQARPDPGNKKTRSPSVWRLFYCSEVSSLYTSLTARHHPTKNGNGGRWNRCWKSFRSACVWVCVEFGESWALTPAVWATWPAQRKKENWFAAGDGGESKLLGTFSRLFGNNNLIAFRWEWSC